MPRKEINREALTGEMVTLHYINGVFITPTEVLKDFLAYNACNGIRSGFTDIKICEADVGKTVLEYMVDMMPKLMRLSDYQYATILNLPEARSTNPRNTGG